MSTVTRFSRLGAGLIVGGICTLALTGCGAVALVSATATVTGQAIKTTGKAAGTAARATIGGAKAAGRLATKPFRDDPEETASK
jgi:hypothetical protein